MTLLQDQLQTERSMSSVGRSLCAFMTYFRSISATIICSMLVTQVVDAQNRSREVQTLWSFKNSLMDEYYFLTFGSSYISSDVDQAVSYWSTWKNTDENPCAWVGVTCSDRFTVQELDLSYWGLGWNYINSPPSLGVLYTLTDLRHLDLSHNSLNAIPDDVGNLTGLTFLDLSNNDLTSSSIPTNLAACRNLRYLFLGGNSLGGEIPSLSGLVNLQVLSLADNQLVGQFPKEVAGMTRLVSIDLSGNMLNGTIPSFSNMTNLLYLNLASNSFTEFEEPWSASGTLEYLLLSGNQLEGNIPPIVTNLLNIVVLNMSSNEFSGDIPSGFSRLQVNGSVWLDLSQNNLTGQIPADLLQSSLTADSVSLNFSSNSLSGTIPIGDAQLHAYNFLDFSDNQLSGPISSLFNVTRISALFLQNNLLSEDIVTLLAAVCSSSEVPGEMRLNSNGLTGDLSRIPSSGVCSDAYYGNALKILDLRDNALRMSTPDGLFNIFFFLEELWLGGNNFSGTALPTVYNASNDLSSTLAVLDVSNNHLVGVVSSEFFTNYQFPRLTFLNLSNNDLTGPLPESIFKIPYLTTLDVSNNKLSGKLPTILPSSVLYNPSFFVGNDDLCGEFLHSCSNSTSQLRRAGSEEDWQWWVWFVVVGGSIIIVTISLGSVLALTWQWKLYHKRHQQDADLIKALHERDSTTLMTLQELARATDKFAQSARIGEGGFGTVYAGTLYDGTKVAIKKSKREGSVQHKNQFLNEVRILSQVNHRNLVKLLGCCMENNTSLLVFEFISNGTLQEHLKGKFPSSPLNWEQRLNIAVQTADALSYLHSTANFPIYHRDVKSANILLDFDLNAKVADFGISRLAPIEATHVSTAAVQGTMGYIDPEYYTSYQLTDKSDVYSFGVVLLELISAKSAIDYKRGGEETSLVNFAKPQILKAELGRVLDPILMEAYSDPSGRGKKSILNVGKLALRCVDMRAKMRPGMKDVWKRLQNLWLDFNGAMRPEDPLDEDAINTTGSGEHPAVLGGSASGNSSTFSLHSQSGDIEAAQSVSLVKRFRSKSFH